MNVIAEQPNLFRAKRTSISTCIRLPARSRFGKGRRSPWGLESKLWNTIADTLVDSGSNLIRLLSLSSHVPGMTHRLWCSWLPLLSYKTSSRGSKNLKEQSERVSQPAPAIPMRAGADTMKYILVAMSGMTFCIWMRQVGRPDSTTKLVLSNLYPLKSLKLTSYL